MKREIKHRTTGAVLFSLECTSLKLCVEAAVKSQSNLSRSNLFRSDLSGAYLSGADLSRAEGVDANRTTPLRFLYDQVGAIRLYKLVTSDSEGPYARNQGYEPLNYTIGKTASVSLFNADESVQCGAGISLATLDWCMREWREGYRILVAEFDREDLVCVPTCTDGKIRVKKCTIIGEKDLVELGLVKAESAGAVED